MPESRNVGRRALTSAAKVDFKKQRGPLLLIAGGNDRVIPTALNRANLRAYSGNPSVTDYHEFAGRTHFIIGQEGWQEVAEFSLAWLQKQP